MSSHSTVSVKARTSKTMPAPAAPTGTSPIKVSDTTIHRLTDVFKLLADKSRLKIVLALAQDGELHVSALCDLLGQSQPAVSHHLALLRAAGVIESRRDGKHNFYRLILKRCQAYLDAVFEVDAAGNRHIRFEDALLTYGRDGQAS